MPPTDLIKPCRTDLNQCDDTTNVFIGQLICADARFAEYIGPQSRKNKVAKDLSIALAEKIEMPAR